MKTSLRPYSDEEAYRFTTWFERNKILNYFLFLVFSVQYGCNEQYDCSEPYDDHHLIKQDIRNMLPL